METDPVSKTRHSLEQQAMEKAQKPSNPDEEYGTTENFYSSFAK